MMQNPNQKIKPRKRMKRGNYNVVKNTTPEL
jgi:hypothetical protein